MIGQLLRHIFVFFSLVSLTLTSALQFTHNLQHNEAHTCHQGQSDASDQNADLCALCWFVTHQLSDEHKLLAFLPHASVYTLFRLELVSLTVKSSEILLLLQQGRAPPIYVVS